MRAMLYVVVLLLFFPPCTPTRKTKGKSCHADNDHVGNCLRRRRCILSKRNSYQVSNECKRYEVCCFVARTVVVTATATSGSDRFDSNGKRKRNVTSRAADVPVPNLREKGCGMRSTAMRDFVVGGQEADYWPWMAAIFERPRAGSAPRFKCGATVISKRYILTAAHCLHEAGRPIPAIRLTVRMGGLTQEGDGHVYRVAAVKIHEDYRSRLRYDDIALLKLSEDIESKYVVPACLPSPGMYSANFYNRNATVLGWGRTSEGGSLSGTLREGVVSIVPNNKCDPRYRGLGSLSLPRGIIDTQLCAGTEDGTTDACQGDSGGPLMLRDRSLKWNVVGIVSFGYSCADPAYPGVYTRVARYLPWLRNHTDIPARYTS